VLHAVGVAADTEAAPVVLGSAARDGGFDLEAAITPLGAAVQRLTLSKSRFFKTVEDRHLPPAERAAMDLVPSDIPTPALLIPELRVWLKGIEGGIPVDLSQVVWRVDAAQTSTTRAVLEADVLDAADRVLLTVRRTYGLSRSKVPAAGEPDYPAYDMDMSLEFVRATEDVERVSYVLQGPPPLAREDPRGDQRKAVVGMRSDTKVDISQYQAAKDRQADADVAGSRVQWIGEVDRYFAVLVVPGRRTDSGFVPQQDDFYAVTATVFYNDKPAGAAEADLHLPGVRLRTREEPFGTDTTVRNDYLVFAGPKDQRLLEAHYANLGLQDLIQWGACCGLGPLGSMTAGISKLMVVLLDAFYAVVHNYGVAIIILVLVLRVVMHPATRWSIKSMMKMQKLGPKMQELRKRYADDKARLNQEMMKFTREEGFSPLSGCLPMFLQMPIWVGLYGALQAAVQLRHAAFLPASWLPDGSMFSTFLQDLAQPDALVRWSAPVQLPGQSVPILGWLVRSIQAMMGNPAGITSFNILPILMAISMYLQQRLTPTAPTADDAQAKQQKKMMGFMMIFMFLILYNAQAGLCLYIFTSSLLGFFETRYLRNRYQTLEDAAAAVAGATAAPRTESKPLPPPAKQKPFGMSGRDRSIAERIQSWLQKKLDAAKDDQAKKGRK